MTLLVLLPLLALLFQLIPVFRIDFCYGVCDDGDRLGIHQLNVLFPVVVVHGWFLAVELDHSLAALCDHFSLLSSEDDGDCLSPGERTMPVLRVKNINRRSRF